MIEKEEDDSNKKEDINENNNIINTNSTKINETNKNKINNENLNDINSSEEPKVFECELLNRGKINKINLIINEQKKNIEIQLCTNNDNKEESSENKEEFISLKTINQIDFIGFMSQEDISEIRMSQIKNSMLLNNDENKENSNLLNEKEICCLCFMPNINKSNCNCLNCIFCCDCSCRKAYKIRNMETDYLLIKTDYIAQIKKYLYNISLPKLHELQSKDRKRKILAFINPIGGKGNALTLWQRAQKVLTQANLDIDTIITQQFKEAYNYVLTLDPMKYDGFIACSGDGIIHEIINAIFHRNEEDKNKFLENCAICAIPAGSGNAISKAISYYCGDDNSIENQCYYLCKGIKKKIDVQEMQLKGLDKKVYSVIAFMYGFLAECDLESEFLRCIGFFRTSIWGLYRYICLRDYLGCLYYLPEDASEDMINKLPNIDENIEDETKYGLIRLNDQFYIFIENDIKFSSESLKSHPLAELDDGYSEIFMIPQSKGGGRWPLLRYLINDMDNGNFFTDENKKNVKNGYQYIKTKWWRFIPKYNINDPDDVNHELNSTKMYSIDGERYPICPVQCRTINKVFSLYSGKE